jgi:general secretion pathway protein K
MIEKKQLGRKTLHIYFRRLFHNPLKTSRKGVALLMATTSLILMAYIASEVTKDSSLEYVVNSQEINRIKAYYAARNSLSIALLRVKTYQQVAQMNLPGGFADQVDQIWKFPFGWPLPIPPQLTSNDPESSDEKSKEALFDGQYDHTIMDEGSKIDINDLNSPSEILRQTTTAQLLNIFTQQIDSNDEFRNQYQNYNFTELINRITDWMTDKPDNVSKNGGDKRQAFAGLGSDQYPPNRGFRTIDELRLVPGMTEEFFMLLQPQITIYGMKAINPNLASSKVLKSLDKNMTDEAIKNVLERRDDPDKGGPFKGASSDECRKDFRNYVATFGVQPDQEFDKIPFICDKVLNFRIIASGRSGSGKGSIQKKIIAVVMDVQKAGSKLKSYVDKEKKDAQGSNPNPGGNPNPTAGLKDSAQNAKQDPLPKGRPRVVYWSEI